MNRYEVYIKIKNMLINKSEYGKYNKQYFEKYSYLGENAPINSELLKGMPNGEIILSKEVYEFLEIIKDVTSEDKKEFTFLLFGTYLDNTVIFDDYYSNNDNCSSTSATYNNETILKMEDFIKKNNGTKAVLCKGHSHPKIGNLYKNFSVGDLISSYKMFHDNDVFKDRSVELISCMIPEDDNPNFLFYDSQVDNFYKFQNIKVRNFNKDITR